MVISWGKVRINLLPDYSEVFYIHLLFVKAINVRPELLIIVPTAAAVEHFDCNILIPLHTDVRRSEFWTKQVLVSIKISEPFSAIM